MICKMENEMMSLYDFLGRPAGGELGKQVAAAAAKAKVGFETKEVSNPKYKGSVMMYPKEFLTEYFSPPKLDEDLQNTIWSDSNKNGRNLGRDFGF
jgi:hypothetical protein